MTGHNVELLYPSQWRTDTLSNLAGSVTMATADSVTMAKKRGVGVFYQLLFIACVKYKKIFKTLTH